MNRTTILKDLEIKAASSTPVEPFTNMAKEVVLNVCLTENDNAKVNTGAALAKTPGGTIVQIEYTNYSAKSSGNHNIIFQL